MLLSVLDESHLSYNVVNIAHGRHIFIHPLKIICGGEHPPSSKGFVSQNAFTLPPHYGLPSASERQFTARKKALPTSIDVHSSQTFGGCRDTLVIAAHYDCVANSEGANDNGASVFLILDAAIKLNRALATDLLHAKTKKTEGIKNRKDDSLLFILTDKEELQAGESITSQGSYTLAKMLTGIGMGNASFFIFDACGRGDTLIISSIVDELLKYENSGSSAKTKKQFQKLRGAALSAAEKTLSGSYLLMPTPFSDDVGFLRAGVSAQTITILPRSEAMAFTQQVRSNILYRTALISSKQKKLQSKLKLPKTWEYLNGPNDTIEKLTPQNFRDVVKFIMELCKTAMA
ncbi:MAG: hypothetical protein Ta2B_25430 [Termitinemataceae bacterium]|nr:MAG: hypothetical protein Ta2B_25430 [Termitinemataceae bacterium]